MNKFFLLFLLAFSLSLPAWAEKESLGTLKKKLEQEAREKENLEAQTSQLEGELKNTKGKLVEVSQSIQGNEKSLQDLEKRIAELEVQKKTLSETLQADRQGMARLILALERLRRVPPEALIARPGAPLQTAQSSMLMRELLPALYHKAEAARSNLAQLSSVADDLKAKKQAALKTSEDLGKESKELAGLVDKREELYASTTRDLEERKANIERISAQSKSLQDLMRRLDDDRIAGSKPGGARKLAGLTPPPRPGQPQLPASGAIRIRYSEPDGFGAPSKGITIDARPGALVVAPMGGVVRFAGNFRNYGNMVILEHQGGYHSLIAGLQKIDTVVGQSVAAGEPLGLLGKGLEGSRPALYYELRLNGEPVNPSRKFTELG